MVQVSINLVLSITIIDFIPLDEQLRIIELEPAELEKCENISEVSANTICTKAKSGHEKCQVT